MRTVQFISMMKLTLPPVVSSGQYQIMESRIAMVEHIAMTDRAMTGPQWHNLRTSWRFSNVRKVDRMFIFPPQSYYQYFCCSIPATCYFLPLLSCKVSGADGAHIFSRLLTIQQLAWSWVSGAPCVPLFFTLAKNRSILSCCSWEYTILVTGSNSPSKKGDRNLKR